MAETEKSRKKQLPREGCVWCKHPASCLRRYHSRAARDMTGTGPSRYRGHKRQDVMCRHWRTFGVMLAPFATANCSTLRRKCRRAVPGLFFGLRVSLLPCSRVLRTFGVMLAPFATANCSTLRRKCRRAVPGLFFGLRVSLLPCSRVLRTSCCKQGGTVEYKCVEPS